MGRKIIFEIVERQVFGFFDLLLGQKLGRFELDFICDVERAAVVPLQVSPAHHEQVALLFVLAEKAVADEGDDVFLLDLF